VCVLRHDPLEFTDCTEVSALRRMKAIGHEARLTGRASRRTGRVAQRARRRLVMPSPARPRPSRA